VKCWGDNANGRLGLGDSRNRGDAPGQLGDALPVLSLGSSARVRALAAHGGTHSCALLEDAHGKCWGSNSFGALGVGDMRDRGADDTTLGDSLPSVDLGAQRASAIAAGASVSCAILADDSTRCWGYNQYAALGAGDRLDRGATLASLGENLRAVSLGAGRHARAVRASSGNHVCALLDDGAIKCWGGNGRGQLGQGDGDTIGDEAGELGDALPAVDLRPPVGDTP
jgi:alpha-tubulin suppressor-like RCC1 family protein